MVTGTDLIIEQNDGKRLYKENQAYILKILAFQEK